MYVVVSTDPVFCHPRTGLPCGSSPLILTSYLHPLSLTGREVLWFTARSTVLVWFLAIHPPSSFRALRVDRQFTSDRHCVLLPSPWPLARLMCLLLTLTGSIARQRLINIVCARWTCRSISSPLLTSTTSHTLARVAGRCVLLIVSGVAC